MVLACPVVRVTSRTPLLASLSGASAAPFLLAWELKHNTGFFPLFANREKVFCFHPQKRLYIYICRAGWFIFRDFWNSDGDAEMFVVFWAALSYNNLATAKRVNHYSDRLRYVLKKATALLG